MGLLASDVGAGNSHVDVVGCLEKIFSKGKSGFGSDRTAERVDPCNLQYGEVTYQGMEPLYDALGLRKGDVFYDLGCGVGKLVLYVALRGEISRSVGLEVGERRHVLAEGACKQLSGELEIQRAGGISELPTLGAACADFSVLLADISRQRYFDPTVVVLTNLCMDMGVQNRTVTCLLRCPSFRRLVSITPMLPHARLKLVGSVQVACTWAKVSAWQWGDNAPAPTMKAFCAFACLFVGAVLSAKIITKQVGLQREESITSECAGNVLPGVEGSVLGKAKYNGVIDTSVLQTALEASQHWKIHEAWELSFTANSLRRGITKLAFSGGGSDGFFEVTIEAGAIDKKVNMTALVKTRARETQWNYVGPDARVTDQEVKITNICLRPKQCWSAVDQCKPTDQWKPIDDLSTPGSTRSQCCVNVLCKDADVCKPASKYGQIAGYDTEIGSTTDRCCVKHPCTAGLCNTTKLKPRTGSGLLGSTEDECCEPRYCEEYTCEETTTHTRYKGSNGTALLGSTDAECCMGKYCSTFSCDNAGLQDKDGKDNLKGSTFTECCTLRYCEEFNCTAGWVSKSTTKANGERRAGFTNDICCERFYCSDYNCSSDKLKKLVGEESRLGHSDEDCCEPKQCKEWTCSDSTKWVHKPDVDITGLALLGYSQDECCDKIMCYTFDCNPASKWQAIQNQTLLAIAQGSTFQECCEPIYCGTHKCPGDDDGDGDSTTWYKKVDTNHAKHQGSTDTECCVAKRCNQYTTKFSTKYKRKADKTLLGSTDEECYDPKLCSDHCCEGTHQKLKPHAEKILGSTDAECCLPK
eukprot:TRINITY_DN4246_c0_g1_i2.p1 TRINITY_DN4246_c0_g1~~TRINITY_DN4246_c0_g1_i2.p1  ORF type:complete len:809 (+),score=168.47 TRINITY_DN4246_c0_g1_i2:79-2505(+)